MRVKTVAFLWAARSFQIGTGVDTSSSPNGGDDGRTMPPATHWKEIDLKYLEGYLEDAKEKRLITYLNIYGYRCSHCIDMQPNLEKVAKKVLSETSDVQFARIDVHAHMGAQIGEVLSKLYPTTFKAVEPNELGAGVLAPNIYELIGDTSNLLDRSKYHFSEGAHKTFRNLIRNRVTGIGLPYGKKSMKEEKEEM